MPPDFTSKEGDALPVWSDTLSYSNGEAANLEGATVAFQMRSLLSERPLTLTGETKVITAKEGKVQFAPSAADTGEAGEYMASWLVTFSSGKRMTFPTTGYLWVQIEPSVGTVGGVQLVSVAQVHDYLDLPAQDRVHDYRLRTHIEAVKPLIEQMVGPMAEKVYDEWHEGGHATIALRHRPSYGFGTSPILNLMACSEYRGPIEYTLSIVSTPTQGSVYSTKAHEELGLIVRRTAGGGTYPFWRDPSHPQQSVHVVYAAGQEKIPPNVQLAALEAIRVNYRTTRGTGRGRETIADAEETGPPLGFFLPRRSLELLAPMRRHPALA
jgi:hypothetical protein